MPIARFAVQRRIAVTMIAAAIIVLGIFAVPRLPVALLPAFSPPVISVSVDYPNVGPDQMETLVTRPIENAVSRVNGIDVIDSTSAQGLSEVQATFHYGVNIDTASVDVQQQVDRIRGQLPNDPTLGQPQIAKFDANSLPIVRMYVTDPTMSVRDLGDLFTNQLADEFSSVSGVASVGVTVDQQRAIMIQPDANLLAGYGLTMNQIVTRLQQENVTLPAGVVQVGQNEYQLRTSALYQTSDQIAGTLITTKNGVPIFLRDIASVQDAITEQRTFQRLNGTPAVGVSINAQPDANVVATASGVYAKIHAMEQRYPGMHFGIVLDQQSFIQQAVNALEHTAIYGAVLAVLVILLFLHSWRSTLIVAISLPISVLGTLFVAYLLGYSLNVMTLGGLALAVGLIVDDAIVVIENIARHRVREPNPTAAAESAVTEIFSAVLASSITVITVFVPLILIPGLQGLLFTPFAVMVMVAVALSLVVALTTVPMLSTVLWKRGPTANGSGGEGRYARFVRGFDRRYEQFADWYKRRLTWAVDHPMPVFATAGLILAVTLVALQFGVVKTEIFPASNSRYVRFTFRMPNGTALDVTNKVIQDIEGRMMKDPRTLDVGVQVGSEARSNYASLYATLKPSVSGAEAARFVQQWQGALTGAGAGGRGGGAPNAQRLAQMRQRFGAPITGLIASGRTTDIVSNIISRGQDALDIQIYGPDFPTLLNIAHQQVIPRLAQLPGISRPDTNITDSQPELDVVVDRTKANSLGLSTQAISQTIDTATSGTIATYLQINGTQYPVEIQLPPEQRRSLASIAELSIPSSAVPASGLLINSSPAPGSVGLPTVPLGEVAQINIGQGPSQITRENKQREIDISATLLGTPLGSVVGAATSVMNGISLPAGYHWQFGQAVTAQSSTFSSLGLIVLLAIVLIYMLLASQFESLLHPLVIMVAVPLSIAGVVLALVITQRAFGLTAFIGLLMLVGIVVKNAILVVQFTNELRARGLPPRDAVLQAAPLRLRPILMTTLATIGGMLPITIGIEEGSQTQSPLGTVVIGGLIVSTMLSLIVVPTLYMWVATHIEPRFGGFRHARDGRAPVPGEEPAPEPAPIRRR